MIAIELAMYAFKTEERLRRNRLLLNTTLNGIREGVLSSNMEGRVIFMNHAAVEMTGCAAPEAHGRRLDEVLILEDFDSEEESPRSWQNVKRPDGSRVPVEVQSHRLEHTDDQESPVLITVLRDISESRRYQRSLLEARNAAEAAARAKSIFISKMSHELRTPLNGILGMVDLSLEEDLAAPLSNYLAVLKRSAEHLLHLVNDILVSTKTGIESSRREQFSPRSLVETIVRSHAFEANRRGLRLVLRIDPRLPEQISADPRQIGRILENLLSNALKFTQKGHIVVELAYLEKGNVGFQVGDGRTTVLRCRNGVSEPRIRLTVADTGIGIPDKKRDEIFREYYQVDERPNRDVAGAGLGLAIVARLVERLGAGLDVQSYPGSGSSFRVEIPVLSDSSKLTQEAVYEDRPGSDTPIVVYTNDTLLARSIEPHTTALRAELRTLSVDRIVAEIATLDATRTVRIVFDRDGYDALLRLCGTERPPRLSEIVIIDTFTDQGELSELADVRVLRFIEPLTVETIRSIVLGSDSRSEVQQPTAKNEAADHVRDRVAEIIASGSKREIGKKIRSLRRTTEDPDLQEILFRLSIAYQRDETLRIERILDQLNHFGSSHEGG